MKLSEQYLQSNLQTQMPDGETWSAYEYEVMRLDCVRVYGHICALEATLEFGNYMAGKSAQAELSDIAKKYGLEYE
jgi:hypothetical protein